jgi:chromosome segregation ATPase
LQEKIIELEREVRRLEKLTLKVAELELKLVQAEAAADHHRCPLDWEHWETRLHAKICELERKQDEIVEVRQQLAEVQEADRAKAKQISHLNLRLEVLSTSPAEVKRLQGVNAGLQRQIAELAGELRREKGGKLAVSRENELLRLENERAAAEYQVGRDLLQQSQTEVETISAVLDDTKGQVAERGSEVANLKAEVARQLAEKKAGPFPELGAVADEIRAHDQQLSDLAERLNGILGSDGPLDKEGLAQTASEIHGQCQKLRSTIERITESADELS